MTRGWPLFLAGLVLAVTGCQSAGDEPAGGEAPPVQVQTARAALAPIPRAFEAGGALQARTTAAVASRILATVLSVEAAPGDRVKAGQRLVVLDARELDAQSRHADAMAGAARHAVDAAEAELEGARAALLLAQKTHDRMAMLHASGATAAHELDLATAGLRGAETRSMAAEARLIEARAAVTATDEAARAARATAAFAVIHAPFEGVVTEKLAEPGNMAVPGAPLLRLEDARLRLDVRLDESRAASLAIGHPVDVLLDRSGAAAGGDAIAGTVAELSRAVDTGSHSFLVKIDIPPRADLRSGMFARARFTGPPRAALAVPREALVTRGQLPTLFVVEDGRARMRVVRVGESAGVVEILAGLIAGEQVIVPPPPGLRDGDAVRSAPPFEGT
jgi:RND family efflux transporter MFP subunit